MTITYTIVIDLARPLKTNTIEIHEGDNNSRKLRVVLMNDGRRLDMYEKDADGNITSRYTSAVVKGVKPDNTIISADGIISEDADGNMINEVTYTLPEDFTTAVGLTTYTITLSSSTGTSLTTPEFYIKVINQLYNEESYISENDLSGFKDILNRSQTALKRIDEYLESGIKNPFPITITIGSTTYTYDGSAAVNVSFKDGNNIAY